jgi:hypothetical protein
MAILNSHNRNCAPRGWFGRFSQAREHGRISCLALAVGVTVFWLGLAARSQSVSHEYPLKAVFLFNFAQFTEWPTNAFETPDSPLVIGVLGDDPFGALLDDAVRGEAVNGRKFVVEHYRRVQEIKSCHILFISQSETRRLDAITDTLKGKPTLTVSDIDGSVYHNVSIWLITENNRIRLKINLDALKSANLMMNSKLLRMAEIVPDKNQ